MNHRYQKKIGAFNTAGVSTVCLSVLLLLLTTSVFAQSITAIVDRTEALEQDQIVFRLTVEGSQNAQPQLPELPDFDIYNRGQSSQYQIINGRATSNVIYNYILVPRRVGNLTIGQATVEIDGKLYQSRPINIRVAKASAQPQQSQDLYITAKVSTTKPFVGQGVIYTWKFIRRVRVGDARIEPLQFPGFLVENLGDVKEYQTVINGQQHLVSEFRKILFPQEEGELTIPGSVLNCQVFTQNRSRRRSVFDDFFSSNQTQTKIIRSKAITINVKPLPPAPREFSGLIGNFELATAISKRSLKVGESATLTITISGSGNAQMISEPELPQLKSFKIYDDKPSSSINRSGKSLSGAKSFRKALVPLEAGTLIIPPISFSYFNPSAGSFQTSRTDKIMLQVSPSDGKEELRLTESIAPTTGKVAVRILADDILPIYKDINALVVPTFSSRPGRLLILGLIAPAIMFGIFLTVHKRQQRYRFDVGLKRRRQAYRKALKSLSAISDDTTSREATTTAASLCLRTYIGDKLAIEGSALTPTEVRSYLSDFGVKEKLAQQTHKLLKDLEAAQYGTASIKTSEISSEIKAIMSQLERSIKG